MNPVDITPFTRRELLRGTFGAGAGAWLALNPALSWAADAVLSPTAEADWPAVAALMHRYVDAKKLAGIVSTFGWGKSPAQMLTLGSGAMDQKQALDADSLFRIYSMTKPVTGLLTAMLIDEGKLSLETKLADICSEFSAMQVAIDPLVGLESRAAAVPITIRHLLTHTAGFGYASVGQEKVSAELLRRGLSPGAITRRKIAGVTSLVPTPAADDFLRETAKVPLVAEPGTVWRYSMSMDILGLVLARHQGRPLGEILKERIFGPAGMTSTFFQLPKAEIHRFTANYAIVKGKPFTLDKAKGSVFLDKQPFEYGGAGLVVSPRDFDRFMALMLGEGVLDGRQLVSASAVRLAMSNLLPPGDVTKGTRMAGAGFGAGGRVGLGADEGSFGWSGAAGTLFFIQRRIGLRAAMYTQFMPPQVYPVQQEFMAAARADALARLKRGAR